MTGFAVLLALGAIVLSIIAAARAASSATDIRSLTRRLDEAERALRATRGAAPVDSTKSPQVTAAPPAREQEREAAPLIPPPVSTVAPPTPVSRSDEFAQATSRRLAEESAAFRAERDHSLESASAMPANLESSVVPPPLPRAQSRPAAHRGAAPAAPGVGDWIKKLGPNDPTMSWEMALGTYWLPRVGALALAAAIVFLLSLAFQKWGPPIRVGLGFAVSGALLALGWRLDNKFPAYARVLIALGLALTYFVTFATYFVPYAQIFDTPYVTLVGLAAIVGAWAALAQRRNSQVLAGVTLGLGHFTIALTTYALAAPGPFSVAGIVFLSLGGAYFLARNGWFVIGALGLAASYANHFYLMTQIDSSGTPFEFVVGFGILSTYFAVYTGAELLAPDAIRRDRIPFWFRNAFAVMNTLAFLALGSLLMDGYDFAADEQHLFRYGLAAALLLTSILYLRVRAGDSLYNTYFVKGISAATWGLATQFDANALSTGLAIETALLLFAARRSGLLVTRLMAYGVGAIALAQSFYSLIDMPSVAHSDADFMRHAIQAAIMLNAFLLAAWIYRYTDWSVRSPSRTMFGDTTNAALWQLDLFAAPPAGHDQRKPLDGHLYPYLFSLAGALLGAMYTMRLAAQHEEPVALAALSLGLVAAAITLRMRAYGLAALVFFAVAIYSDSGALWDVHPAVRVATIGMLGLVAFATESRYLGEREGLGLFRIRAVPYALYGAVALLVALNVSTQFEGDVRIILGIVAAAIVFAAGAIPLHRRALAWCAVGLLGWAQIRWLVNWDEPVSTAYLGTTWTLVALGIALERYFAAVRAPIAGPVALCLSTLTFAAYILFDASTGWVAVCWATGGIVLLAFGGATRGRTAVALGVLGLAAASLNQFGASLNWPIETTPLVLGFVVPAAGWIALERAAQTITGRVGVTQNVQPALGALPAIATALLALMLFKLPHATTYYLTLSWCGLGIALFVLAVMFKERTYRFCGLAVLGLATFRAAFIDTRELEALPRVFALGGLGLVLLALGFAYVRVFARSKEMTEVADNTP